MTNTISKRYLYLDDERTPTTNMPWTIVRSYQDAVSYIRENGIPDFISFDHDICDRLTGYDFAKWLVESDLDREFTFPDGFKFNVHSANPVGAQNIQSLLNNYLRHRNA